MKDSRLGTGAGVGSGSTLYEQLKAHVRTAIQAGEYLPGEKLPPETELMRKFGVSRNTVTRALNDLVGEGLLLRIRGSGTYVRKREPVPQSLDSSNSGRTGAGGDVRPLRLGVVADMAVPVGNPYVTSILAGISEALPSLDAQAVLLGAAWDDGAGLPTREPAKNDAVAEAMAGASAQSVESAESVESVESAETVEIVETVGDAGAEPDAEGGVAVARAVSRPTLGARTETVTLLNLAANTDGLIVIAPRRQHLASLRALERHRIPFVVVGSRLDMTWHPWHNVYVDNAGSAAEVARHLLMLGHRRLVCLTGSWEMQDSADRAAGFRSACLAAELLELPGIPPAGGAGEKEAAGAGAVTGAITLARTVAGARAGAGAEAGAKAVAGAGAKAVAGAGAGAVEADLVAEEASPAVAQTGGNGSFRIVELADEKRWHLTVPEAVRHLMTSCPADERPTAIFAAGFSLALAARRTLQELGLSVPGDVSLIGFDDSIAAAYLDPPLTTVEQPLADMGSLAVRILVAALHGELPRPVQRSLAARLVIRGSTAPRSQD